MAAGVGDNGEEVNPFGSEAGASELGAEGGDVIALVDLETELLELGSI